MWAVGCRFCGNVGLSRRCAAGRTSLPIDVPAAPIDIPAASACHRIGSKAGRFRVWTSGWMHAEASQSRADAVVVSSTNLVHPTSRCWRCSRRGSEPPCRTSLQTTMSCFGQEFAVVGDTEKGAARTVSSLETRGCFDEQKFDVHQLPATTPMARCRRAQQRTDWTESPILGATFPMSQWEALKPWGSKGQRSRCWLYHLRGKA